MKIPKFVRHSIVYSWIKRTSFGKNYLIRSRKVIPYTKVEEYLSLAPVVKMRDYIKKPCVGIVKDGFRFDQYVSPLSSWIYYERFLKENDIFSLWN